jgi:hypothetical protein
MSQNKAREGKDWMSLIARWFKEREWKKSVREGEKEGA